MMTTTKHPTARQLLATAFVGSMLFLSGCSASEGDATADDAASSAPAESSAEPSADPSAAEESAAPAPEPDLEGIPDVVAVVNGTEIGKEIFTSTYESQFAQASAQSQATGQELDQGQLKTTVADNLVSTELLRQEADRRGIEVTPEARTAAIDELLASSQLGSEEELRAAFAEQGLEGEEFESQLSDQVRLDALLTEEAGDTTPTDQEVQEVYDGAVAQQQSSGETATPIPPLEEVRAEVEEQIRGDKTSTATEALIARLREEGDITVNL
jgi:hypothetical protein